MQTTKAATVKSARLSSSKQAGDRQGLSINTPADTLGKGRFPVRIPLTDPIWSRLYGPYGFMDVPSILKSLEKSWDKDLAEDLFWEALHHQDDLYPATYATLPWLMKLTDFICTFTGIDAPTPDQLGLPLGD
ncbi:MAG: hypothetical protein ABJH45_08940 [Paracoccaceae bacterium]